MTRSVVVGVSLARGLRSHHILRACKEIPMAAAKKAKKAAPKKAAKKK
jgi:hypothetical protein